MFHSSEHVYPLLVRKALGPASDMVKERARGRYPKRNGRISSDCAIVFCRSMVRDRAELHERAMYSCIHFILVDCISLQRAGYESEACLQSRQTQLITRDVCPQGFFEVSRAHTNIDVRISGIMIREIGASRLRAEVRACSRVRSSFISSSIFRRSASILSCNEVESIWEVGGALVARFLVACWPTVAEHFQIRSESKQMMTSSATSNPLQP